MELTTLDFPINETQKSYKSILAVAIGVLRKCGTVATPSQKFLAIWNHIMKILTMMNQMVLW
jgi:hypothetical protein